MGDCSDIDQLLADLGIEGKPSAVKTPAPLPKPISPESTDGGILSFPTGTPKRRGKSQDDDLDDLLKQLADSPKPRPSLSGSNSSPSLPKCSPILVKQNSAAGMLQRGTTKIKCSPVPHLGGAGDPAGRAVGTSVCVCDQLRCTKCDFRIQMFDGMRWQETAEYLFFRNNMPSREKLTAQLTYCDGFRAFCCQCTWRSADAAAPISPADGVRWVCAGHPN
eukprot:Rmarinus@m.11086